MKTKLSIALALAILTTAVFSAESSAGGGGNRFRRHVIRNHRIKKFVAVAPLRPVTIYRPRVIHQPYVVTAPRVLIDPGELHWSPELGFQGRMIPGLGMKILSVRLGSPARAIGLNTGDVITRINGRNILAQWDYDQAMKDAFALSGGQVDMTIRSGQVGLGNHFFTASTTLNN